jgi:flotillin
LLLIILISLYFRKVVPTNEVHIVQSSKITTPYGKDLEAGAVYYNWPSWFPVVGIARIILPTSMFTIELTGYYAYDQEKVPFIVDVMAWFRVEDAKTAAQRIENFSVLKSQLDDILKGAVRAVLASDNVVSIMEIRKELGEKFKSEVLQQCEEYGVYTVNIDFMDIRDPNDESSNVIADIMEKKKSLIEKESRIEVANNKKDARIAEIDAVKEADLINEAALQAVGEREALKQQRV